jgi:RNA 2',3'-cyclic 3'-phosphodiesterase
MYPTEPQSSAGQSEREADGECQPLAVRCFLAVPLAEPALSEARRFQASLADRVAGVRWARPETLHLTVHFFGSIDDSRAASAVDLLAPVASHTPAFDVELGRLGAFPPRGAPRVLWLGPTSEVAQLAALALECRSVLGSAGFDVESRQYHPHGTLGRVRAAWSEDERMTWQSMVAEPVPLLRFTATRLVLYESRSEPGGARYTEWSAVPFAAR